MINWVSIGRAHFEKVINLLVKKEWESSADVRVTPIDGRGGDGGIDIEVIEADGRLTVYQLKYFTDGMSGGNKSRRRQVSASWERVKLNPDLGEWILVLPSELTPSEIAFIQNLPNPQGVKITVWSTADLDLRLATHPDLARFAERTDPHLEDAKALRTEQAELLDPVRDLQERVSRLGQQGSAADPNWDFSFSHERGETSIVATPKALNEVTPSLTADLRFRTDSEMYEQSQKILGFGQDQKLHLGEELQHIAFDGMPFVPDGSEMSELTVHPKTNVPPNLLNAPISITLYDKDNNRIATHVGITEHLGRGPVGFTWRVFCFHSLRITFFGQTVAGVSTPNPELHLRPAGASPSDLKDALTFVNELPNTNKFNLRSGNDVDLNWASSGFIMGSQEDVNELLSFADDLIAIERLAKTKFILSEYVTPEDVVLARIVRSLLEGVTCAAPMLVGAEFTMLSEGAAAFSGASSLPRDDIRVPSSQFSVTLLGVDVRIGHVEMWHPQILATVNQIESDETQSRVQLDLPEGQCFILTPTQSRDHEVQGSPINWPISRGKVPVWLTDLIHSMEKED